MSCLGVHFALTEEDVSALRRIRDEQERLEFLKQHIEERYFSEPMTYAADAGRRNNALHRTALSGIVGASGSRCDRR